MRLRLNLIFYISLTGVGLLSGDGLPAGRAEDGPCSVEIRVRGPTGALVPGLPLALRGASGAVRSAGRTGPDGVLRLSGIPLDGSLQVLLPAEEAGPATARRWAEPGHVLAARMDLVSSRGLSLDVIWVAAESGRVLEEVAWRLRSGDGPLPAGATAVGPRTVWARPGGSAAFDLEVRPPTGRVRWGGAPFGAAVARRATALSLVAPLYSEADLELRLRSKEGRILEDVHVTAASIEGEEIEVVAEALPGGGLRLRGVPALPRARLALEVETGASGGAFGGASWEGELRSPLRIELALDPSWSAWRDEPFRGPPENFTTGVGGDGTPLPSHVTGRLAIHGRLRDGAPAAEVGVAVTPAGALAAWAPPRRGTLDENGRLLLEDLPVGPWSIRFAEPGVLPTPTRAEVGGGGLATVTLAEEAGGHLRVEVRDDAGRPVPFARLHLALGMWLDVVDGVQRLDAYVDARGGRHLREVPPGRTRLRASYLGLEGEGAAVVEAGRGARLVIVVR